MFSNQQCYDSFHRQLQKLKLEFHTNVVKIGGPEPDHNDKDEETSRIDKLIERSGMIRSSTEQPSSLSILASPSPPQKQHHGLRCKKCFELLVRDDEFMQMLNGFCDHMQICWRKAFYQSASSEKSSLGCSSFTRNHRKIFFSIFLSIPYNVGVLQASPQCGKSGSSYLRQSRHFLLQVADRKDNLD